MLQKQFRVGEAVQESSWMALALDHPKFKYHISLEKVANLSGLSSLLCKLERQY